MDASKLAEGLAVLGLIFDKEVPDVLLDAYASVLSDLTDAELERGLQRSMKECRFFPRPVEIRERGINSLERLDKALREERRMLEEQKRLENR